MRNCNKNNVMTSHFVKNLKTASMHQEHYISQTVISLNSKSDFLVYDSTIHLRSKIKKHESWLGLRLIVIRTTINPD